MADLLRFGVCFGGGGEAEDASKTFLKTFLKNEKSIQIIKTGRNQLWGGLNFAFCRIYMQMHACKFPKREGLG